MIGVRSGGKVDSVLSLPSSLVLRPLSRNSLLACLDVGTGGGDGSGRKARDQVATRRRRFVCFLRSLPYRIGAHWCMGSPLPLSPHLLALGPLLLLLLLLRPFQSLRVDVKIAPSPLELAPMEPIGRPDDELRLREGGRKREGREVYR